MSGRFMKMAASGLRGGMGKAVSIQYRVQHPVGRKVPMVVKAMLISDPLRTVPYVYGKSNRPTGDGVSTPSVEYGGTRPG
jgi:hypothetical protein